MWSPSPYSLTSTLVPGVSRNRCRKGFGTTIRPTSSTAASIGSTRPVVPTADAVETTTPEEPQDGGFDWDVSPPHGILPDSPKGTVDDHPEASRHQLHQALIDALGDQEAAILMEHLPPVGWADVATKADIDNLRVATKTDIDNLRAATDTRFDVIAAEFATVRREMSAEFAGVRKELSTGLTPSTTGSARPQPSSEPS